MNCYKTLFENQVATREIASNLFANTECNGFGVGDLFANGDATFLTTDAHWSSYLIENNQGLGYTPF